MVELSEEREYVFGSEKNTYCKTLLGALRIFGCGAPADSERDNRPAGQKSRNLSGEKDEAAMDTAMMRRLYRCGICATA